MEEYVIGVDVGGINTSLGLVDKAGRMIASDAFRTSDYPYFDDYEAYVERLASGIAALSEGARIQGVGIGAPAANYYTGQMEQPADLFRFRPDEAIKDPKRRYFPLCDQLEAWFPNLPIRMTNDANAAALGEMAYGAARGMRDFIMITLGTGLGSGFVAGGQMIYGRDGMAGELGHTIVEPGGRACACGRRGCLETYVSATGVRRTAFSLMATELWDSPLRAVSWENFDARILTEAAESGDPLAVETFRRTGEQLGRALANAVAITSPEAIILFGGLARAGHHLFEPTRAYMEENLLENYRGKVRLLPSALPAADAAVLGAAGVIGRPF